MIGEILARLRYFDEYNDQAPPSFCGRVADYIEKLQAERDASKLIINDLTAEVEDLRSQLAARERLRMKDERKLWENVAGGL